ncbi:hypothetical protein ElyMa_001009100 [Elysia marginata]|uniref:Uncharacterized protein n=1 Tax=Elysia marginata TaxID=1093978 RepID=A0AAV4HL01_9GAST|nr:hypothetical protein ElyMa_001009100 [Elysia marginata]
MEIPTGMLKCVSNSCAVYNEFLKSRQSSANTTKLNSNAPSENRPTGTSSNQRTVEKFNKKEKLLESLIQLKEEAEMSERTSNSKSSKKMDEADGQMIPDQLPVLHLTCSLASLSNIATTKRKKKPSDAGDADILQFLERREARKMEIREKELELRREELRQQRENDESEGKERDALLKALMALSQK